MSHINAYIIIIIIIIILSMYSLKTTPLLLKISFFILEEFAITLTTKASKEE